MIIISLKATVKTNRAEGQYLLVNPPELIVGKLVLHFLCTNHIKFLDEPFDAGCFNVSDSILGESTTIPNLGGKIKRTSNSLLYHTLLDCAVQCKSLNKKISALKDSECFCLEEMPYSDLSVSDECIRFYVAGEIM